MKHFSCSDKGPVRKENQDCASTETIRAAHCEIAVVCDGMGGARGGQTASTLALGTFTDDLRRHLTAGRKNAVLLPVWMRMACEAANRAVYTRSTSDADCAGMGTTLVAAVLHGRRAEILNVGDSRAYRVTRKGLEQLTRDHSYVAELVAAGNLSAEEARRHPNRNLITRAVGVDETVEPDLYAVTLRRGEALLLCSDGLYNTLSEAQIHVLCRAHRRPDALCRALIDAAGAHGARDNVTAAILKP